MRVGRVVNWWRVLISRVTVVGHDVAMLSRSQQSLATTTKQVLEGEMLGDDNNTINTEPLTAPVSKNSVYQLSPGLVLNAHKFKGCNRKVGSRGGMPRLAGGRQPCRGLCCD